MWLHVAGNDSLTIKVNELNFKFSHIEYHPSDSKVPKQILRLITNPWTLNFTHCLTEIIFVRIWQSQPTHGGCPWKQKGKLNEGSVELTTTRPIAILSNVPREFEIKGQKNKIWGGP